MVYTYDYIMKNYLYVDPVTFDMYFYQMNKVF
jgi:hypothetical protein